MTSDPANQMFQSGDLLLAFEITTEATTPKTHAANIVARVKAMVARSIARCYDRFWPFSSRQRRHASLRSPRYLSSVSQRSVRLAAISVALREVGRRCE
jgi:hypothetical protein